MELCRKISSGSIADAHGDEVDILRSDESGEEVWAEYACDSGRQPFGVEGVGVGFKCGAHAGEVVAAIGEDLQFFVVFLKDGGFGIDEAAQFLAESGFSVGFILSEGGLALLLTEGGLALGFGGSALLGGVGIAPLLEAMGKGVFTRGIDVSFKRGECAADLVEQLGDGGALVVHLLQRLAAAVDVESHLSIGLIGHGGFEQGLAGSEGAVVALGVEGEGFGGDARKLLHALGAEGWEGGHVFGGLVD